MDKSRWEYKKLNETTCLIADGDWIESKHQANCGIRLIQTGNIGNGIFKAKDDKPHYISETTFNELCCTEIFEGDCLISRLPDPVGRSCLIPNIGNRMITAVDCTILRFKNKLIPSFFVYYTLSNRYKKEIEGNVTGSTRKRISRKNLEKIVVPVPLLSEQQHIVEELDLLSSIIEKKKAQLNELDNLAQSLFYEMFGDPIINNMEWEVKTLKELVYIGLGFTHTPQYIEKGVPFISVKDISSGYIDLSNIKYVSKEEYDNAPKGAKPQKGDLMFCRVGTMGKPLIVETDMQFCTFVSVGYMRKLQNNIDMSFLKYWMMSNSFDKQVEANVRGLAIKNLNTGWLKNFSIYLPPLSLQKQFASKIEAIEHQKELIKQSIKEVETLFNSRMDYYFN